MRFVITFSCDNAAFDDPAEAARILRNIADQSENTPLAHGAGRPIFDINGNRIGEWIIVADNDGEKS